MAFGDRQQTYKVNLPPGEMPAHGDKVPVRKVKVPMGDRPWWWSEYLMDEWNRKNGRTAKRESRSKWQQAQDDYAMETHRWDPDAPHFAATPVYRIWDPLA